MYTGTLIPKDVIELATRMLASYEIFNSTQTKYDDAQGDDDNF